MVHSLHNLRYRLIEAIADAGSYKNRVHRFHLSLDGFSSVEGLSHFFPHLTTRIAPTYALNALTPAAQRGADEEESDSSSSAATILPHESARGCDVAAGSMLLQTARQDDVVVHMCVGNDDTRLPPILTEVSGDVRPQPVQSKHVCSKWRGVPCLVPHRWRLSIAWYQGPGSATYQCERCHLETSIPPMRYIATF